MTRNLLVPVVTDQSVESISRLEVNALSVISKQHYLALGPNPAETESTSYTQCAVPQEIGYNLCNW